MFGGPTPGAFTAEVVAVPTDRWPLGPVPPSGFVPSPGALIRSGLTERSGGMGIGFQPIVTRVIARTSPIPRGSLIELDYARASVSTTGYAQPPTAASCFGAGIYPASSLGVLGGAHYAIALNDIDENQVGHGCIFGIVEALLAKSAGASPIRPGDALQAATSGVLDAAFTAGRPYRAIALEETPSPSGTLRRVLFFGAGYLGTYVSGIGGGSGVYTSTPGTGGGGTGR